MLFLFCGMFGNKFGTVYTKYSQNLTVDCDLHAAYFTLIVMLVKMIHFHR